MHSHEKLHEERPRHMFAQGVHTEKELCTFKNNFIYEKDVQEIFLNLNTYLSIIYYNNNVIL